MPGGHIVDEMFRVSRGWYNAGDGGMAKDKFQKELPPTSAVELARPCGKGFAFHRAKNAPVCKWAIGDNGCADLGGEFEHALFRFAFGN